LNNMFFLKINCDVSKNKRFFIGIKNSNNEVTTCNKIF